MSQPYPSHAFPGGYPVYYVTEDGGVLCPTCANVNRNLTTERDNAQWFIVADEINWEDPMLLCDHCSHRIESAYAEEYQ